MMNITPEVAYLAIFPTTALTDPYPPDSAPQDCLLEHHLIWDESSLNPKNRIDSLVPVKNPKWRIDGCTRMATQFYTIPTFIDPLVPIRTDTFIPLRENWPLEVIKMLDSERAFLCSDARIVRFGLAQHILRTLEHWTSQSSNFETEYMNFPFGSHIVLDNMAKDVRQIRVRVVPMHELEREFLSVTSLHCLWPDIPSLPPAIEIAKLSLVRQLHDSISLVRPHVTRNPLESPRHDEIGSIIFKGLLLHPKYLYHELHTLLTLPPHPNIQTRPLHLVTKRCYFGGKIGVVGFTTAYHSQGTLRDILPLRHIHGTLELIPHQLKWARQLTAALIHMKTHNLYHCDLRLDNILLSDTDDILLIDFEHRGILANSAAPEVSCLEYVELIANHTSYTTGARREMYEELYHRFIEPHVQSLHLDDAYCGGRQGYYVPWLCLSDREREAAEVYMLGRILWCIFEGVSAPNTMLGVEYVREPDLEFPEFRRTPLEMRDLVMRCTRGWTAWLGGLRRHGGQLRFIDDSPDMPAAEDLVAEIAERCRDELENAVEFFKKWNERREAGNENVFDRPTVKEIAQELSDFENSLKTEL